MANKGLIFGLIGTAALGAFLLGKDIVDGINERNEKKKQDAWYTEKNKRYEDLIAETGAMIPGMNKLFEQQKEAQTQEEKDELQAQRDVLIKQYEDLWKKIHVLINKRYPELLDTDMDTCEPDII